MNLLEFKEKSNTLEKFVDRYREVKKYTYKCLQQEIYIEETIVEFIEKLRQLNYYDVAEELCDKVLAVDNNNDKFLKQKGILLADKGQPEESLEYLDKASDINPDDAEIWKFKAKSYAQLGNTTEVYNCTVQALKIDPDNAEILCLQGVLDTMSNNYELAIQKINKACELEPNNVQYQKTLSNTQLLSIKRNKELPN